MGCWNSTCMVSGLPIEYKDKVVAFALKESGGCFGGECYANAEADIISPPIFAEYNDYGSIENVDKNDDILIFEKFIMEKTSAATGYDLGVDTDNEFHYYKMESVEDVYEMIERGYATLPFRHEKGKATLSWAMVRREIWDDLIIPFGNKICWKGSTIKESINQSISAKVESLIEMEEIIYRSRNNILEGVELIEDQKKEVRKKLNENEILKKHTDYSSAISLWQGPLGYSKETIFNLLLFNDYCEHMRLHYRPPTGRGSQIAEWGMHKEMLIKSLDICEDKIKERD
jgi:hypothetical protein